MKKKKSKFYKKWWFWTIIGIIIYLVIGTFNSSPGVSPILKIIGWPISILNHGFNAPHNEIWSGGCNKNSDISCVEDKCIHSNGRYNPDLNGGTCECRGTCTWNQVGCDCLTY